MELITKAPKGTVDIIPGESEKWSLVEAVMTDEALTYFLNWSPRSS